MIELNLPNIDYKIRKAGSNVEIFDIIRKKFIVVTPEEWVRQHFIHYLYFGLGYSKSLIKVESGLKYNQRMKRSDILVYNNDVKPLILVECKSYKVKINQNGFNQLSVYNKTINAKYLILTNGLSHFCCEHDKQTNDFKFLDSIPHNK